MRDLHRRTRHGAAEDKLLEGRTVSDVQAGVKDELGRGGWAVCNPDLLERRPQHGDLLVRSLAEHLSMRDLQSGRVVQ